MPEPLCKKTTWYYEGRNKILRQLFLKNGSSVFIELCSMTERQERNDEVWQVYAIREFFETANVQKP